MPWRLNFDLHVLYDCLRDLLSVKQEIFAARSEMEVRDAGDALDQEGNG